MKKLKSSLKLSRLNSLSSSTSSSTSSISSAEYSNSSNTNKLVRFAPQLTTVKNFDVNDEPISISNQSSPLFYPIDHISSFSNNNNNNNLWDFNFNDIENNFDLNYFDSFNNKFNNIISPTIYDKDIKANIINSNFVNEIYNNNNNNNNNNIHLDTYQQIKLINVSLINDCLIRGTIKVRNFQYQKFIQCKFTFDNWKQCHYITADYSFSPTKYEDVFIFDIDLNSWKFYLHYNHLIDDSTSKKFNNNNNTLTLEFVCMYSINDTIYYDNNNYQNFIVNLSISPKLNDSISSLSNNNNNNNNLSTTTTTTNNVMKNTGRFVTRKFSKDTDYYNESPLKHMFHTDTYWVHPKNQNKLSFFVDDQMKMQEMDYDTLINNVTITPSLSSSYSDLSSWDTDESENEYCSYYFDCYDYDYTFSPLLNNINSGNFTTTTTTNNSNNNNPYQDSSSMTNNNNNNNNYYSTDTLLGFDRKWDDREYFYNPDSNIYLDNEDNETITSTNEMNNSKCEYITI